MPAPTTTRSPLGGGLATLERGKRRRDAHDAGRDRAGAPHPVRQRAVEEHGVALLEHVFVAGELWHARQSMTEDEEPELTVGEKVVVERVHGLTLSVRRAEEWEVLP